MAPLIPAGVRNTARDVRRVLRLSPMYAVLREMRRRGVMIDSCDVLECFAFTGGMHTLDYARSVRGLELWEINPVHEPILRKRFPGAEVRIVDTYEEVARRDRRFDMIVIDNSPVHGSHVEHFDLFPAMFRLMQDSCVVVLDVMPNLHAGVRRRYPEFFSESVLRTRAEFYGVTDPYTIPEAALVAPYEACARRQGYDVTWYFLQKRNPIITYLVLYVQRGRR